jgi:hypothetical protein
VDACCVLDGWQYAVSLRVPDPLRPRLLAHDLLNPAHKRPPAGLSRQLETHQARSTSLLKRAVFDGFQQPHIVGSYRGMEGQEADFSVNQRVGGFVRDVQNAADNAPQG